MKTFAEKLESGEADLNDYNNFLIESFNPITIFKGSFFKMVGNAFNYYMP